MVELKKCCTCEKELPVAEFHSYSLSSDGLQPRCKSCKKESNKKHNSNRSSYARMKYPVKEDKIVYAFKDGNEIVYIGETDKGAWRIYEHYNHPNGKTFCKELNKLERQKRFSWHVLWYGDNDEYRKYQEKELIKLHKPKYNKTWVNES